MGRVLCIDYGRARIGVAYSDTAKSFSFPLQVFLKHKKIELTYREIQTKISHLVPFDLIVIGLPLLLNGKEGEMAEEAKAFGIALSAFLSIPHLFWDERLTSSQADRILKEGNLSRKERSKLSDTMAASIILQNYLDYERLKKK
jgi:putative Holliday junction resolvase